MFYLLNMLSIVNILNILIILNILNILNIFNILNTLNILTILKIFNILENHRTIGWFSLASSDSWVTVCGHLNLWICVFNLEQK